MFYHIYVPIPHPQEIHFFFLGQEKNPWHDVGVSDERNTNEDCFGGLTFSF